MQKLLLEMKNNYYNWRKIDSISHAIEIQEIVTDDVHPKDFFRMAIHSTIPTKYLGDRMPIIGMGMTGTNLAVGEERALVYRIAKEIAPVELEEIDKPIKEIIDDAYDRLGDIKAVFLPIRYLSQIFTDFKMDYSAKRLDVVKDGKYQFKVVHSTNASIWGEIVIVGSGALRWTRKITRKLPPNLSDFMYISEKEEHLQLAYLMDQKDCHFMIGTVSRCEILNPEQIAVYQPPKVFT